MIEIKIIIMSICASLFWLGGAYWHNARRFIMPFLLTVSALFFCHWEWWNISMISSIGILCLGYGDNSWLRKVFGNGWGRGIWGLLVAICLSFPLLLTHNLSIWFLVPYLALNFTLENALKNIPQFIGDPIIGLGFSCIILLIHP